MTAKAKIVAVPHAPPLGLPPRLLGLPPRSLGLPPRSLGLPPRLLGMPPRSLGLSPRLLGMPPRSLGLYPRMSGLHPRPLGMSPRSWQAIWVTVTHALPFTVSSTLRSHCSGWPWYTFPAHYIRIANRHQMQDKKNFQNQKQSP